jgi:hypothetical protein
MFWILVTIMFTIKASEYLPRYVVVKDCVVLVRSRVVEYKVVVEGI